MTADGVELPGVVRVPADPVGAVVFAHGSSGSDLSPLNTRVATTLNGAGLATLLLDLLTPAEAEDQRSLFAIPLLAGRLAAATAWLATDASTASLPVGCFGASTGVAAALWAAVAGTRLQTIVSHDGRPDLARARLHQVRAPTLLIVGSFDTAVIELNEEARMHMRCECELQLVPGVTHLFERPRALETVSELARDWFLRHLGSELPWV